MIYLDNAATTRPCAEAVAAVNDALTARWGNPSAVHRLGIEAARLLRTARQDVAEAMGAETERVFFTSGGTEGLPAIAAFASACRALLPKRTESIARQRRLLAQAQELLRAIDGVQLLGAQEAPHILNLAVPGVRSQGLINALQERDIYVSAGSACSKGHRSHVLEAMGVDAAWIDGSVRVSLSDETTEDDIRALAEALPAVLTELRGGGRRA